MSNIDLTKVLFDSRIPAFKNNNVYTGVVAITGSAAGGTNTRTFTVTLGTSPEIYQVMINGLSDATDDIRPNDGWFQEGSVWVLGNNAPESYDDYPTPWRINTFVNGATLTIVATYVQQFDAALTLTSTNINYRVVDYSVATS